MRGEITGMEWKKNGITREVILIGKYAIKIPKLIYGWSNFLLGLLANMQETSVWSCKSEKLCPVLFSVPGGWLIIMKRARPLTDDEWSDFDPFSFRKEGDYEIPMELKQDSFGVLDDKIVAVDYGN